MEDYIDIIHKLNRKSEKHNEMWSLLSSASVALCAQDGRIEKLENLLKRLRAWDHFETASDGPYWRKEIDKVFLED